MYHNITPGHFFEGHDGRMARACRAAREELYQLAGIAGRGHAFSRFSAEELAAVGFSEVERIPFLIDWGAFDVEPDPALRAELSDGYTNVFFVGRAVPNKRLEDVLRVFTAYQRLYNPRSRLVVAGEVDPNSPYVSWLRALRAQLKSERVMFLGRVTQAQLSACYATASVYLSMSQHEGFGVPLVEAMHRGVPVVAYGAAAVPETLGGAGIATLTREPIEVAKVLAMLDRNPDVRERLIARERRRAEDFDPGRVIPVLRAALAPLIDGSVLRAERPASDLPGVLIVCPRLDAEPGDRLSRAARSLAGTLAAHCDARLLTLKARGWPEGPGPEAERERSVTVLKYSPELPLEDGSRQLPLSSSLQSAVLSSRALVVYFGSDQPLVRALLPDTAGRAFVVDGPGVESCAAVEALGPRRHVGSDDGLDDAVQAVLAQVLDRVEKGGRPWQAS